MAKVINITKSSLRAKVNEGMTREELSEFFGIPKSEVISLLKQANFKIKKGVISVLVDDETPVPANTPEASNITGSGSESQPEATINPSGQVEMFSPSESDEQH